MTEESAESLDAQQAKALAESGVSTESGESTPEEEVEVVEGAAGPALEPKMSPLQRVKAQQAALQKNRQKGARKGAGRSEEAGPSEGPAQRVQIQRRSGGA